MFRLLFVLFLFIASYSYSQDVVKKPLSIDDFAGWKTINNQQISNNGDIVVYELNPQKGDGVLIINRAQKQKSDTILRGYNAVISPENNFVVFKIKQPEQVIRKAKLDKVKKDKMPADSVGVFNIKNHSVVKYANIKSFAIPEENADWIALLLNLEEPKDSTTTDDKPSKKEEVKQPGDDLIMCNPELEDTLHFSNVTEVKFAKKGAQLIFISQTKDTANTFSTVQLFDTKKGVAETVYNAEGWAEKLAIDETSSQYAFLFSQDTIDEKMFSLYHSSIEKNTPQKIVGSQTQGIPIGWSPSKFGSIYFSKDGSKLYFGNAPIPEPEKKDSILDEEKPKLDIWNWKDLKLQPQQKVEMKKEKERTFLAVYHVNTSEVIQLADLNIKSIRTIQKGNANVALGIDNNPYQRAASWTGKVPGDYYLIDLRTGIKRMIAEEKSGVHLSPGGKFIVWYEQSDSSYYSRSTSLANPEVISLTKILPVNFYNELNDIPFEPRPYGIAGWSENDRFVFIYDRYDIWKVDPTGVKVPVLITHAFGRRNKTRLRYVKLDPEQEFISAEKPMLLKAFDERTMSAGFFAAEINTAKTPLLLVMDKYKFSNPKKAKNAERIIWTKEDVKTFPDLWYSHSNFESSKRISYANPQQVNFIWPTVISVKWSSFTGEDLKGLLYLPENFDPGKKYPTIVYYYERMSESLHQYYRPSPSRSIINKSFYPSNGYIVFIPDITYKIGYPGQSAYNSIVSGISNLVANYSFIDKNKIGLQGQSWGGYQTAYLITQTDMFTAAMGGAVVSNMTSAYGGIRWASGMSRMFQYEHTQSRIGGTLWEKPLLYIENSPIFYAPKVNTPFLTMHNDNDGAVPWYQGIEFFVALRRLNKPVWMLTYNGEPHNLKAGSWANRVDLSTRMFQFFNHYLKGKPMPEWMEKGVPAVDKGENLGY